MKTPSPETVNRAHRMCAGMSSEEKDVFIASLMERAEDAENLCIEKDRIISDMRKKFNNMESEFNAVTDENKELKQQLAHVSENFDRAQKARFGQSSEQLDNIAKASPAQEVKDEDETEDTGEEENPQAAGTCSRKSGSSKHKGGTGKTARNFSGMEFVDVDDYDVKKLLEECGPDARVIGDNESYAFIYVRARIVVLRKHRPTIACGSGPDTKIITTAAKPEQWPNSLASPSLVAHIAYERFPLCLTYYRIEQEFANLGIRLGRQTMSNWVIRAANDVFKPVWTYMKGLLLAMGYVQCDETTVDVLNDGRKAGSKSYIWWQTTSELFTEFCIILACYEKTRGTEHLREFFKGYKGIIICDAYVAYLLLESESEGAIRVCGCMMHMRRRFVDALALLKPAKLPKEILRALPEYRALDLIKKIYAAEKPLKKLSAEERKEERDKKVRPKIKDFYAYIESLDTNDPHMGETLKDAVQYAINHKDRLTRFLEDGNIPIDNGFVERAIRPFTTLRRNSLFCTSIEGAEATAIICSIVETAKANKARVDIYLEYLLEKVPQILDPWGNYDDADMATMMPWSEEYRAYEEQYTSRLGSISDVPPGTNLYREPPKTPGKPKPEEPAAGNLPPAA